MPYSSVHRLPILIAAAAAWMFGMFYYGLLADQWVAAHGGNMQAAGTEPATRGRIADTVAFILSFVAEVVMAVVLWGIMDHVGIFTMRAGVIAGAACWLGFVLIPLAVNDAYGGRQPMLTLIEAGHWLGVLMIMGAVLGVMGR